MSRAVGCASIRFWIILPCHARHLARRLSRQGMAGMTWCYLGTDIRRRERLTKALAPLRWVAIGEDLNRKADHLKGPFSDWIADLGSEQTDPRNWWASRLASKSPAQTDFFLLVCYAECVRNWLEQGTGPAEYVVVEDPWLFQALRRQFHPDKRVEFPFGHRVRLAMEWIYWLARIPFSVSCTLRWFLWLMLKARLLFPKGDGDGSSVGKRVVLIHTWIEPRCFPRPGAFQDPYTGRLEDLLRQQGEEVRRISPVKIPSCFLPRLKEFLPGFIITQRYLRLSDILQAACSLFHIEGLRRFSNFQGVDYLPLFTRELLREWGDPSFACYRLTYLTFRRMANRWKDSVKLVIYTFENQPWEKMLCMAFREGIPQVRLIGYQHTCVNPLWLNYFPGKREFLYAPMPDRVVANGGLSLDLLRQGGYPPEWLCDGGAFRYEHLFDAGANGSTETGPKPSGAPYRVLVVLSVSWLHASSLLRTLRQLFQTPFLDSPEQIRVEFVVKCHPGWPLEMLLDRSERLPAWVTVSEQPLSDLLKGADLFLYVPPTTARWEAYLAGLPMMKYRDEFLDMDAMDPPGEELAFPCTRDTLRSTMKGLLQRGRRPSPVGRQTVLSRVFSPVNEQLWAALTGSPLS